MEVCWAFVSWLDLGEYDESIYCIEGSLAKHACLLSIGKSFDRVGGITVPFDVFAEFLPTAAR